MAAHRRPGQAGRAVRRQLPADRLRAVQPGQRRAAPDLRAHPVQVALAGPAHLHHLAAVQRARPVHHHRAGPAAARPALVHRQRRRDLPEPEPRLRRAAGLHRGVRRRPRLPDGPGPDDRPAHRERAPASPSPASGCRAPRRRRSACIDSDADGTDHRVPGEALRPARGARRPGRDVRVDGQLRLHHRGAARRAARGRRGRRLRPRHGRRHHPAHGRAGATPPSTTSPTTWCPARPTATPATGATSAPSTPTTRRTSTSCRCTRSSTSTTSGGRSARRRRRCRRPSSSRAASRRTPSSAPARSSPGRSCAAR